MTMVAPRLAAVTAAAIESYRQPLAQTSHPVQMPSSQTFPPGQVPVQVPPQPSWPPLHLPVQSGMQTHCPFWHCSLPVQTSHVPLPPQAAFVVPAWQTPLPSQQLAQGWQTLALVQVSQAPQGGLQPHETQLTACLQLLITVPHFPAQVWAVDCGVQAFFFFFLRFRFFFLAPASSAPMTARRPPTAGSAARAPRVRRRELPAERDRVKASNRRVSSDVVLSRAASLAICRGRTRPHLIGGMPA